MESKRRILIVEDSSASRKLLTVVLDRAGYDIVEAANGLEAINLARVTQPDLIIMDIEMPEMSGDQVLEQVKADASTQHIPVIIITVHDRDSLPVQRAIAAGAAKVIYKPASPKAIEDEVRQFLFP